MENKSARFVGGEKTAIVGENKKKGFYFKLSKQVLKFRKQRKGSCVLCSALELFEPRYLVSQGIFVVEFGVFFEYKKKTKK